jgi:acetyl esterase/lipase
MREHGYLVASLNYRLCAPGGAKLVDSSTDCKDAVRFLVKNIAAYGIDTGRIASMGTSSGGSLALLLPLCADFVTP